MKKRVLSILLLCLLMDFLLGVGRADALTGNVTSTEQVEIPGRDESAEQVKKEFPIMRNSDTTETAAEDEILARLREDISVCGIRNKMGASRLKGTEQELLALIYKHMEAWENAGGHIRGQIDLSFEGLVLASLECGDARQVFVAVPEGIYRLSSLSVDDRDEWKELVQGILEDVFGERGLEREQTENFFYGSRGSCGQVTLWYKGVHYLLDPHKDEFLLSWERGEEGISFQVAYRGRGWEEGDDFSRRIFELRRLEGLGRTESGREMREQLQELWPGMMTCHIWTEKDVFFAEAECPGTESQVVYGTSRTWQEETYQIRCTNPAGENDTPALEQLIWENADWESYYWSCNEGAVLRERDEMGGYYVYRRDIGRGRPYTFFVHRREEEKEDRTSLKYILSVYAEEALQGKERPFCELEIGREPMDSVELSFEDLNGDGYEDVLLGSDPVEKCYLWSTSGEGYVDITEALGGCFDFYQTDAEKRQLCVWKSAYSYSSWGTRIEVYQWTGELDCELLKEFQREFIYERDRDDWQEITITVREDGAEKVLTDYIYPSGEYSDRADEIREIWKLDFVWEQEVKINEEENPCILRYAQEETREEDGTVLYTDRVFLFRWDTYLLGSYSGVVSSAPWKKLFMDEAGRLKVTYKDGSSIVYSREFYE